MDNLITFKRGNLNKTFSVSTTQFYKLLDKLTDEED